MIKLTKAKKAGPCRSGGDSRGTVVHLIENQDEQSVGALGESLCGTFPHLSWSSDIGTRHHTCPKCQKKLDKIERDGQNVQIMEPVW